MFFIGIFGIQQKEKEVAILVKLSCKICKREGPIKLIKSYTYFHFFFIPLFKWNESYYVICEQCKSIYSISKEKGKAAEHGDINSITYWDLKDTGYGPKRCEACGREIDQSFEYCPHCGHKLK